MSVFFFFSSRRRHTRWPRDWSSDVCSSDLLGYFMIGLVLYFGGDTLLGLINSLTEFDFINWFYTVTGTLLVLVSFIKPKENTIERLTSWIPRQTTIKGIIILGVIEIGRASCRERVG